MSSQVPNPITRSQLAVPYRASPVLHPDYAYWSSIWEMIRDAEIGEIEIKRKGEKYLPRQKTHDKDQYQSYLKRAVYYNMTARTLNALYGTVFRRAPKIGGLDRRLTQISKKMSKEGMSLHLLTKTVVKEVLAVGRFGMLVDSSPDGRGNPYIACYTAENILDWQMSEIDGQWTLTKVTLREIFYDRDNHWSPYEYRSRFRVLVLEYDEETDSYVYVQYVYLDDSQATNQIPDIDQAPSELVVPTVRGEPLNYIPFMVIGPFTNTPDVQRPPILDIVTLNISHYMSYAQLEQALFYTGSPVFTVQQEDGTDPGEYQVGPDVVWVLGKGETANLMEFNGRGLQHLENALRNKEDQIASIGGRMMPGTSRGAAESDNALMMQERNEQTLLLNLADTVDEGMTTILGWWADWNNAAANTISNITFEVNRDFLIKDAGAREFRAVHQMYADGVIPLDVVYDYLRKFEVIPEWMGEAEYKKMLNDTKQFPNMVDVLARMQDYPDAKAFHEFKMMQLQMQDVAVDPASPEVPRQARDARAMQEQERARSAAEEEEEEDEDEEDGNGNQS